MINTHVNQLDPIRSRGTGTGTSLDVPRHFYSSMDAMATRLLRSAQQASRALRQATNDFVLRRADEDRELKAALVKVVSCI